MPTKFSLKILFSPNGEIVEAVKKLIQALASVDTLIPQSSVTGASENMS
jgi:hypothetical protein